MIPRLAFLLLAFLGICTPLPAQQSQDPPVESLELVNPEKPATFPGGEAEMVRFIFANFHPPVQIEKNQLSSTKIVVSFSVDTSGSLYGFKVLKDMGAGFGEELVRVMHTMPCWIPGEWNGKKVNTQMTLPLQIELD